MILQNSFSVDFIKVFEKKNPNFRKLTVNYFDGMSFTGLKCFQYDICFYMKLK